MCTNRHANSEMNFHKEVCTITVKRLLKLTIRIEHFYFLGCVILGGAQEGIHFTFSRDGRPSGECFVEFASVEDFNR